MAFNAGPLPKQAAALLTGKAKVATYESTGGKTTFKFAAHNLALVPAIKPGSTIHDNACGAGTVSRYILQNGLLDVKIHATDIDQPFLDVLAEDAAQHGWPVEVSNQKSEATSFDDAFFDYDIMNIGIIFMSSAGLDATREMHRTLKPGGFAVVNCWKAITWMLPIMLVHKAFRGEATPFPAPPVNWTDGTQLRKVLVDAGFEETKIHLESHEVSTVLDEGEEFREWVEKTWAFLAGIGGWHQVDEEKWDEEVDMLAALLKKQPGTMVEGGKVTMTASQWVAVAEK
ncbi:S-adenosyl-L-methionine-dependent methyltransferase [Parachaetomium inaequale]|uniref:S-adenosyl-L-methionine-dependent methyltransferase n=1 Tax=Parachaetomium inaequale TaxID=2588326 RepID=A0AAN6SQP0_9PEZI|nr:S-adenosyl-L-methionine-dependent methyltransferase [Parachaetomium inaequale]